LVPPFSAEPAIRCHPGANYHDAVDNTLAYMDQGSFLGLRALGRGPLMQFVWIYDRPVDLDGLRRFQSNLGFGLLGRHIERSPLPFGRHRWVAARGPADLEIAAADRRRDEVWTWADERVCRPIDPEWGPAYRLGVQPLTDGGAAVSLVASHSVADALGLCIAITEAVNGTRRELGYPEPGSRPRGQALRQDLSKTIRSLPDMGRALTATVRLARSARDDLASSVNATPHPVTPGGDHPVVGPTATVWMDLEQWDRRAESLGGTSNSLFAGLASRLALALGREDAQGRVLLSWPVSDRVVGDTRANALTSAMLTADPAKATVTLSEIRRDMKQALTTLAETPNLLLAPLALVPITPKVLARRLETMAAGVGNPSGCSNLGELDPAVNRPDGTDAVALAFRLLEPQVTTGVLDRMGGYLYLASGRVHGQIFVTIGAWTAGGPNTKSRLCDLLRQAVADMELSGTFE
jgi:hypothetical protein